ncbi:MAG: Si-specific NAD(P)(+) transhydrogenase [Phycisphaerales bacterium]
MPQDKFDYDLICIGSGPSGQRAAVQAAKLGYRVAVIDRERMVGGCCLYTGTIPSKTFREAVISHTGYGRRFIPDMGRTTGVKATAASLLEGVGDVIEREADVVAAQLHRNDVAMVRGTAHFKDAHTIEVVSEHDVQTVTSERFLIAVGTIPAPVPTPGLDPEIVTTSDGILTMKRLPRTMAVVGAGVIGIEYASIFAAVGVEVTVIDRRDRVLDFIDHEISDELVHRMRRMNVTFRLDESVADIQVAEQQNRKRGVVTLESGKRVVSDMVLYCIGRIGATSALNLEAAGLRADDRGRIVVNADFQTEVPNIYAAGDVIGYPSLAATSSEQGRLAACHAFGVVARPMGEHFPIGIYAVPELSMVGKTENQLTAAKVPYEVGIAQYREIARGQILGDEDGMLKMLFHRQTRALLGVHAIGSGATELIHIGQAVMHLGGGLDYFLNTVFNYPTLAECYKVAALDAQNKLAI